MSREEFELLSYHEPACIRTLFLFVSFGWSFWASPPESLYALASGALHLSKEREGSARWCGTFNNSPQSTRMIGSHPFPHGCLRKKKSTLQGGWGGLEWGRLRLSRLTHSCSFHTLTRFERGGSIVQKVLISFGCCPICAVVELTSGGDTTSCPPPPAPETNLRVH